VHRKVKFLVVALSISNRRRFLPRRQLSHVGRDQPAPVSSVSVELLEAQALHQFVEDACRTNRIKTCSHTHTHTHTDTHRHTHRHVHTHTHSLYRKKWPHGKRNTLSLKAKGEQIYIYIHISLYKYIYLYINIYIFIYRYIYISIYTYIYIYLCKYIYRYIYRYIYI